MTVETASPEASPKAGRFRIPLIQLVVSLGVIALLLHDARFDRVVSNLSQIHVGWLLAAIGIKAMSLTLHEVRLWVAVCATHPRPLLPVLGIG